MDNALEIRGLDKQLGDFRLRDVAMTLPCGTIMGLIGPNGAGKTTLIKLVLGLLRPDAGEILVHGHGPDRAESRRRVGFVLDEPVFHDFLSPAGLARSIAAFYEDWDRVTFDRLLAEFQIPARKSVGRLSHGTKTKLALAAALSHKADLLILDEPTSGLDPVFRRSLLSRLGEFLQDERRSVLFSTHITTDLERIADSITFLHGGRVIFSENKDDVLARWAVVKGGDELLEPSRAGLFRAVRRRAYGVLALTDRAGEARRALPAAVVERASLEDIMDFLTRGDSRA